MPTLHAYQKFLVANCPEVYVADITELICFYKTYETFLSVDEKESAFSLKKQSDTFAYIIRHGLLHFILSERLAIEPESVFIQHRQDGKPSLDPDRHPENITFSMSSSKNKVAIAIGEKIAIGIDIQFKEPIADYQGIAHRFFSSEEYAYIQHLPKNEIATAFYDCWVCKEAFIKAAGIVPLESFAVSFWKEQPELIASSTPAHLKCKWFFQRFAGGKDYAAMLVKGVCI